MKRNVLIKGFLLIAILISLVAVTLDVNAEAIVLAEPGNNSAGSTTTETAPANNTPANNTPANSAGVSSTLTPTVNNTGNTNLPETGIEDSTVLYVVLGVSAVAAIYAYKKVRDYKGI